jgi:uncharacterized protein (DUF1015 family)
VADVRPLQGVRFNRRLSGPVGPLLAPPYDASASSQDGVAFGIGGIENVDLGVSGDQHAQAARRYRAWREQGILQRDASPSVYIHQHQFQVNGTSRLRTGLIARVRLHDWSERVALPHERTTAEPRQERLERIRAVHANLSPLYFLYRDPDGAILELIAQHAASNMPLDERDRTGGAHRLQRQIDSRFHARLTELFAGRTLFVADGHHRYEAALAYRAERRSELGEDANAPFEFVLALLAAVEDPGVFVGPTHRVLFARDSLTPELLKSLLRRWFEVRVARGPTPTSDADGFICRLVLPPGYGEWDIHAASGKPHLALAPRDRGAAWKSLGVAAVAGVLESVLGVTSGDPRRVTYAVDEHEATRHVRVGDALAAFLLPPPSLDRLLAVAEDGDLLPAKSTWFQPKAPAGLVINDLGP